MEERVEEFQGLFGPVSISEHFIQRLWHKQRFACDPLRLVDGRDLRVIFPGNWNRQEGPDFRGAILMIERETVQGDVEIHFHAEDWNHHGHASDPEFNETVLHAVVFPPRTGGHAIAKTANGRRLPVVELLPFLESDLESLAEQEALRLAEQELEGPESLQELASRDAGDREIFLQQEARRRWLQKVARARYLLDELGWEESCHLLTLEVLGYARNRAQMTAIARGYPLGKIRKALPSAETWYLYQDGLWDLRGLRPANHPRKRLLAYRNLVTMSPYWPDALLDWSHGWLQADSPVADAGDSRGFRKTRRVGPALEALKEVVLHAQLGGTRFLTWIGDAALPLLSAQRGVDYFPYWFHHQPGDSPDLVNTWTRALLEKSHPGRVHAHGWNQGVLACIIREQTGLVQLSFRDLPFG